LVFGFIKDGAVTVQTREVTADLLIRTAKRNTTSGNVALMMN
jgi:hypothetical protein|tara:strand:+ start:104 stop:229 length:126 start_codon:yes stop_codon:yes gene_type:complete